MKIIVLVTSILFSISVLAAARIDIAFPVQEVKQGSLQQSVIRLDETSAQGIELQKLKGQTLGETLYIYSVSPLMRKDGGSVFEAEATVIFVKVPEQNKLTYKTTGTEVEVRWNQISVIPTEAPQELIFGTFSIPSKSKLVTWIGSLILLIILVVIGLKFRRRFLDKKTIKLRRLQIKDELTSGKEYADVVRIWQKKQSYIREFPHTGEPFKELESVLFRYQFKPVQTEAEKIEVMNAYRKFINQIEGGFSGI